MTKVTISTFFILVFCELVLIGISKKIVPLKTRLNEESANDNLTELANNCRCVVYYQCDEQNNIIVDGTGLIDVRLSAGEKVPCSDDLYYCCRDPNPFVTETVTLPETTTTSRVPISLPTSTPTTSTTTATLRGPDNKTEIFFREKRENILGCGKQMTIVDFKIFASDDEITSTVSGEVPWMAAIFKKPSYSDTYDFKCGGSLIHPQVVLTGTHCIKSAKSNEILVIVSGDNLFPVVGSKPETERNAIKLVKHPDYYSGGLYNDIALIILGEPFNMTSKTINTICLPKSDETYEKSRCWASGWGGTKKGELSQVLRKVDVPLVTNEKCEELIQQKRKNPELTLHESFLCAGGEGRDVCWGDGGGPLVCQRGLDYAQIGIVSWGGDCTKGSHPGVYTDVGKFRSWIDDELKKELLI